MAYIGTHFWGIRVRALHPRLCDRPVVGFTYFGSSVLSAPSVQVGGCVDREQLQIGRRPVALVHRLLSASPVEQHGWQPLHAARDRQLVLVRTIYIRDYDAMSPQQCCNIGVRRFHRSARSAPCETAVK